MAAIVGVIAEYHPFHNGHAWHLAEARRRSGAAWVTAVISSWLTQRGTVPLLTPQDRAVMALQCGVDAVFALPAVFAARDAERYALAGVRLLTGLGCTHLAFGAETDDLPLMQRMADILEDGLPPEAQTRLQTGLREGQAWPSALTAAMETLISGCGRVLGQPNNILGLCYLRAIRRLESPLIPVLIPRLGSYRNTDAAVPVPSATALRAALLRGDWPGVRKGMPPAAYRQLQNTVLAGRLLRPERLDPVLLTRLRGMTDSQWQTLPECGEGINQLLRKAASTAATRQELLDMCHTPRYPQARLSRLCAWAALDIRQEALCGEPEAAQLLGFRREARELLRHFAAGGLPILSRSTELMGDAPWLLAERRAADLWALGTGQPAGLLFRQRVQVI